MTHKHGYLRVRVALCAALVLLMAALLATACLRSNQARSSMQGKRKLPPKLQGNRLRI